MLGLCMQFSQLLKVFNFENTRVPNIIRIPWVSYALYLSWSPLSDFFEIHLLFSYKILSNVCLKSGPDPYGTRIYSTCWYQSFLKLVFFLDLALRTSLDTFSILLYMHCNLYFMNGFICMGFADKSLHNYIKAYGNCCSVRRTGQIVRYRETAT